jgi:hypothetical protein
MKDDTGIARGEVEAALAKFSNDRKAFYINEYIVIPKWPKHQKLGERGTLRLGVNSILKGLPQDIKDFITQPGNYEYDTSFLGVNDTPYIPHTENEQNGDGICQKTDGVSISHTYPIDTPSDDLDSDLDSDLDNKEFDIKGVSTENSDPQTLFLNIWQHTPDVFNITARIESPNEWKRFWETSGVTCELVQNAMTNFIADVRSGAIEPRFVPSMPDRFVLKGWIVKCQKQPLPRMEPPRRTGQRRQKNLYERGKNE